MYNDNAVSKTKSISFGIFLLQFLVTHWPTYAAFVISWNRLIIFARLIYCVQLYYFISGLISGAAVSYDFRACFGGLSRLCGIKI